MAGLAVSDLVLLLLFILRGVCLVGVTMAWRDGRHPDSTLWVFAGLLCTLNIQELRG